MTALRDIVPEHLRIDWPHKRFHAQKNLTRLIYTMTNGVEVKRFNGAEEMAEFFGVTRENVSQLILKHGAVREWTLVKKEKKHE